jgi:hypothetical protein
MLHPGIIYRKENPRLNIWRKHGMKKKKKGEQSFVAGKNR